MAVSNHHLVRISRRIFGKPRCRRRTCRFPFHPRHVFTRKWPHGRGRRSLRQSSATRTAFPRLRGHARATRPRGPVTAHPSFNQQQRNITMNTITRIPRWLTVGLLWFSCQITASAFYNPETGRWLSRDPIEEHGFGMIRDDDSNPKLQQGDANLYLFVSND